MKSTNKFILCALSVCMMVAGMAFAADTSSDSEVAVSAQTSTQTAETPRIQLSELQLVGSAGSAGGAGGAGGVAGGAGGGATGGGADVQVAQY